MALKNNHHLQVPGLLHRIFSRVIWILTFLLSKAFLLNAQQRPQYTQYVLNNYLLNPAISGIENYVDLKVGYRNQWIGLKHAPQTSFISAHWKLGRDYLWQNPLSFPEKGESPMSRSYTQNYTASPAHHGMGVAAVSDKAGQISRMNVNLTYAYHLQIDNEFNLSAGLAAGLSQTSLNKAQLIFENPADPALSNLSANELKPDLGLGVWLYSSRLFAGAALQQLLSQKLSFTNNKNYFPVNEVPHMFVTAGYKIFLAEDISAIPSVMVKYVSPVPLSVDLNLKLAMNDKFWLGGSYRKADSFSAMMGFNIGHLAQLSYSYDFTTSALNRVSRGSHEIMLGLLLNNMYKVTCPQRFW